MSQDRDQGSFLTGFTLGIFAGATGYFLFGTDRGGKVREELKAEWTKAQAKLETETPEVVGRLSIREALYKVADWLGEAPTADSKTKKANRKGNKSGPKSRFKGV